MTNPHGSISSGIVRASLASVLLCALIAIIPESGLAQPLEGSQAPEMLDRPSSLTGFQTPSGNFHCMLDDGGDGEASIRCDISRMSGPLPSRPADCDLDWGSAFAIARTGSTGIRICHGDTVRDPDHAVLGYGAVWRAKGLVCRSERSGLTCENGAGHGFSLSRGIQRVF